MLHINREGNLPLQNDVAVSITANAMRAIISSREYMYEYN